MTGNGDVKGSIRMVSCLNTTTCLKGAWHSDPSSFFFTAYCQALI